MKLNLPCGHCFRNGYHDISTEVELNDNGIYEIICPNGHASIDLIKNEKYEILFDLGLLAVNKGFSREAVSSFAVSLERFYEYCIRVMLHANNINKESINSTWKLVSSQSERQVGAFYILFLSTFKNTPSRFSQKQTEFRNKVIHKGYIPSKVEVLEYAETVYDFIIKNTILLKERFEISMNWLFFQKQNETNNKYMGKKVGWFIIGTSLNSNIPIESLKEQKFNFELSIHYLNDHFPLFIE